MVLREPNRRAFEAHQDKAGPDGELSLDVDALPESADLVSYNRRPGNTSSSTLHAPWAASGRERRCLTEGCAIRRVQSFFSLSCRIHESSCHVFDW